MTPIIYLACPYSHPDAEIREARVELATAYAAYLFRQGKVVYSPLTHSFPMVRHGAGENWEAWSRFDLAFLSRCQSMIVLCLPGWQKSRGVTEEIRAAQDAGLPVGLQRLDSHEANYLRHFAGFPTPTFSEPVPLDFEIE